MQCSAFFIYSEKENIYTLDSKGELLITIMSSLAQEESRSISENVTWGQRKRMADGRFNLPYKQFLGYRRGEDGLPQIVPEEAETVRLIYKLYMEGKSYNAIAIRLTEEGIPTPAGKKNWQWCGIHSILTNEKYKGHALLQKTYCADFLAKKIVKNTGQVQQYYVENSHPAIIDPDEWDAVHAEIERRSALSFVGKGGNIFTGKIICGECGSLYWKKTWGSYKDERGKHKKSVYVCSNRQKEKDTAHRCGTPCYKEAQIKSRFLEAFNKLMENRDGLIADCRLARNALCDTTEIDKELAGLRSEIEVAAELARRAICENARSIQDQAEFDKRSNALAERQRKASARFTELEEERRSRVAKSKKLARFIKDIKERPLILNEFDEALWLAVVEKATAAADGTITFSFRNGSEITV